MSCYSSCFLHSTHTNARAQHSTSQLAQQELAACSRRVVHCTAELSTALCSIVGLCCIVYYGTVDGTRAKEKEREREREQFDALRCDVSCWSDQFGSVWIGAVLCAQAVLGGRELRAAGGGRVPRADRALLAGHRSGREPHPRTSPPRPISGLSSRPLLQHISRCDTLDSLLKRISAVY